MTNQELAEKLRCISVVHIDDPGCENCPFHGKEPVPEGMREIVEEDFWPFCDCDRVCHAAADAMENHETHIMALQKAIEDLRARLPRWIPVEERLPGYNRHVLCYRPDMAMKIVISSYDGHYDDDDGGWYEVGWSIYGYDLNGNCVITHWMPLPEGPKEVE